MHRLADDSYKCNAGCGRMTLHGTCSSCQRLRTDRKQALVIRRTRQYKPTHPSWFTRSK